MEGFFSACPSRRVSRRLESRGYLVLSMLSDFLLRMQFPMSERTFTTQFRRERGPDPITPRTTSRSGATRIYDNAGMHFESLAIHESLHKIVRLPAQDLGARLPGTRCLKITGAPPQMHGAPKLTQYYFIGWRWDESGAARARGLRDLCCTLNKS